MQKTESASSVLEDALVKKYMPLIKWASRKYSAKIGDQRYFQRFFDKGIDTFCICLHKWKTEDRFKDRFNSEEGIKEFGKYFKTALFTNFLQLQIFINVNNKKFFFLSFDDLSDTKSLSSKLDLLQSKYGIDKTKFMDNITNDGFGEVRYKELLEQVEDSLEGLALKIFQILVEPPEQLNLNILRENARKMKYFNTTGSKVRGMDSVRLTKTQVYKYFNSKNQISNSEFNESIKKVKKAVLEACHG